MSDKSIENVFINIKWALYDTDKSIFFKSPYEEHYHNRIGIWVAKKFIYPSKYQNQICFGINKNDYYTIYEYPRIGDSKIIDKKKGWDLIKAYELFKQKEKDNYYRTLKVNNYEKN